MSSGNIFAMNVLNSKCLTTAQEEYPGNFAISLFSKSYISKETNSTVSSTACPQTPSPTEFWNMPIHQNVLVLAIRSQTKRRNPRDSPGYSRINPRV